MTKKCNILKSQGCRVFHRAIDSESYPESLICIKGATGRLEKAPWVYSEGGAQGATSSLIVACAAIQPALEAFDKALRPHMGSASKGIDDGVSHAPPDVLWPALHQFYKRLERDGGLVVNRSKTQVYSPNGNYAGMPSLFQIGTITATLTGEDAVPAVVTAQGLTIWGVALSKDGNYIKAAMAIKAEEVCNTINKVTNSFNPLSKDVTLAVI